VRQPVDHPRPQPRHGLPGDSGSVGVWNGPGILNALLPPVMGARLELRPDGRRSVLCVSIAGDSIAHEHLRAAGLQGRLHCLVRGETYRFEVPSGRLAPRARRPPRSYSGLDRTMRAVSSRSATTAAASVTQSTRAGGAWRTRWAGPRRNAGFGSAGEACTGTAEYASTS